MNNPNDFFLDDQNVIDRLVKEWLHHGKLIIAYDYDNTVYDYYKCGHTFTKVIDLLRRCKEAGAYFIVFTASHEDRYEEIRDYLTLHDIPFDKINEDMDFMNFGGRKIYYNILLDDRAGLSSAYHCLLTALNMVEARIGGK